MIRFKVSMRRNLDCCAIISLQAQCLIHIGGDAVKVAYVPLQSISIPPSLTMVAAKA